MLRATQVHARVEAVSRESLLSEHWFNYLDDVLVTTSDAGIELPGMTVAAGTKRYDWRMHRALAYTERARSMRPVATFAPRNVSSGKMSEVTELIEKPRSDGGLFGALAELVTPCMRSSAGEPPCIH